MQVFKRASAAYAAAGNEPILRIHAGDETLYIVGGLTSTTEVNLIGRPEKRGYSPDASRLTEGQVTLSHLSRLGNANHAAGATFNYEANAFEGSGAAHKYYDPKDTAAYHATREAAKLGFKRNMWVRHKDGHREAPIKRFHGGMNDDDCQIIVETYGTLLGDPMESQQDRFCIEDLVLVEVVDA